MVDSAEDREDYLSEVKDTAIRLGDALRSVAASISDPATTEERMVEHAKRILGEAISDSASMNELEDRLDSVVEFDAMGGSDA